MPSSRITDELVRLMFCPPHTAVRDHRNQPVIARDILAVIVLVATLVLLGFAVGAEWVANP